MPRQILQSILIFLILIAPLLTPFTIKAASDFEVISDYNLNYEKGSDLVTVEDFITYKVNNDKYFYQPGLVQYFFLSDYSANKLSAERKFKLNSLKVINNIQIPLKYTANEETDGISIKVTINERISPYEDYTIKLTYKTHDLVNVNGNIVNIYVPGLAKNAQFEEIGQFGLKTTYTYNAKVNTPIDLPLPSYTQPSKVSYKEKDNLRIFDIPASNRLGHVSWLQIGSSQYYKFKLVQHSLQTDKLTPTQLSDLSPIVSTNVYKIALPREYDETSQKVFIQSINPQPKNLERDEEGNLIAVFDVPANKDSTITIEGLISLFKKDVKSSKPVTDMNLADYKERLADLPDLNTYLQPDKYWEVDDPLIISTAETLAKKASSVLELIEADYKYIVDTFEYSHEKLGKGNIRLGAKAALGGSQTICMEYSDALTALLRAQGIPARIAIGYGNDPKSAENKISNDQLLEQTIGHQWTQVWIPDYGWLSVDPTWGESQRKYIGSDLDHILWYTLGSSQQSVTDAIFYSAEQGSIGNHGVHLQALTQSQFEDEKKEAIPLTNMNIIEQRDTESLDFYLKTSLAGRVMVYLIPILATVLVSIAITTVIYYLKRKIMRKI
ncbi:transglutaminase family protein [bacterium]|nr:transglutaminase family protein [bacterium]